MTAHPPGPPAESALPALDMPVSAWVPFRRLMRIVGLSAVLAVLAALAALHLTGAPPRWELWLAVSGGIAGTVLLTGALMGLVFVSNRSGHDDSVGRSD